MSVCQNYKRKVDNQQNVGGTIYPGVKCPQGQDRPGDVTLPSGKVSPWTRYHREQDKLLLKLQNQVPTASDVLDRNGWQDLEVQNKRIVSHSCVIETHRIIANLRPINSLKHQKEDRNQFIFCNVISL